MVRVLLGRMASGRTGLLPAALVIGGTVGNLLDRAAGGGVRDFLVGPAIMFNVADVAILIGVIAVLVSAITERVGGPADR